jgi:hypothetical protein
VSAHPPTLVLEKILRQEPLGESGHWAAHVADCAACAAEVDRMRLEDRAYLETAQAQDLMAKLRQPAAPSRPAVVGRLPRFFLPIALPALALAAAMLLWPKTPVDNPFTAKGNGLELVVQRGTTTGPWDGQPLRANDSLQLSWTSAAGELAVFACEGSEVTQLYPETGERSQAIAASAHRPLGGSVRMDGRTVTIETFFGRAPFDLGPLRAKLQEQSEPTFAGQHRSVTLPGERGP